VVEGGAVDVCALDDLGSDEDGRADEDDRLGRAVVLCVGGGLECVAECVAECVEVAPDGLAPEPGAPEDAGEPDAPLLAPEPPTVTGTPCWPDRSDPFGPDWPAAVVGAVVTPCGAVGECADGLRSSTSAVAMIAMKASAAAASAAAR
jgi:hypothetical protein